MLFEGINCKIYTQYISFGAYQKCDIFLFLNIRYTPRKSSYNYKTNFRLDQVIVATCSFHRIWLANLSPFR